MTTPNAPGGIGYVLRKFPVLSETFVLHEILALEAQEMPLHIFSLAPTRDPRFHEALVRLRAPVVYVPGPTDRKDLASLLRHNRRIAHRRPHAYYRTLGHVLATGRPSYLWRFLQAGYIADKARGLRLTHLHAHFAKRATNAARLASRLLNIPYSFTAHAVDIYADSVNSKHLVRKMHDARFVVTVSDYNKAFLQTHLNGTPGRVVRVYNGIDLERFVTADPPAGMFTIVTVARLVEKKGLDVLLDACRLLRDQGLTFRCRIVGQGAERSRLEAMIRTWQLTGCVELLGARPQQEVIEFYRTAHLFVLPCVVAADGNREGLPVSIVEALASGLPVVSTPVAGIPEVLRDGENGLCVPARDAPALAQAIARLMRDSTLYERLRAAARRSVAAEFDQNRTSAALRRLLEGEAL